MYMKKTPFIVAIIIALVLIVGGLTYFFAIRKANAPEATKDFHADTASTTISSNTPSIYSLPQNQNEVTYFCTEGTLSVNFVNSTLPTSRVLITLPSGKTVTLPQVQSGSGIRYEIGAGTSNSVEFDSEGENAFLVENGTQTLTNCLAGTNKKLGNALSTFTDQSNLFSFSYPSSVTISGSGIGYSSSWMVNTTVLGMILAKATLPSSFEPKTNFANAVFTVGTSADPTALADCLSNTSGDQSIKGTSVTINGTHYEKFISMDVGAGNIYQTTSYRTLKNNQCYAIEYTIHSVNIANFSSDQGISTFDQTKVENLFEGIVQSFTFL